MRKIFFVLLCSLIGGMANAKPAVLKGEVKNMNGKTVQILISTGMVKTVAQATVKDDKFEMEIPIDKSAFLLFWLPNVLKADILVSPDAVMELDLTKAPLFTGDGAKVNNLIVEEQKNCTSNEPAVVNHEIFDAARSKAFYNTYNATVNVIKNSNLSIAEKNCAVGYFQARLLKNLYARVSDSKVFGNSMVVIKVMPDYNNSMPDINFKDEVSWHPCWFFCMEEYLYAKMEKNSLVIKNPTYWLNDFASTFESESLQEAFVLESLKKDVTRGHLYKINERIESAKQLVKSVDGITTLTNFNKGISKTLERFTNCVEGTYVGDYFFNDRKGKKVYLKNFKGNLIFIDLWGTSCSPCIGEIPYIKKIEHELDGKSIVFVSIATDATATSWNYFLAKNKMEGEQLITTNGFKDPFFNCVGLTGIPRFMIIDREGKMVDHFAYRPSNPILKLQLIDLLKNR